jgi:hypothetical protein
MTDLDFSFSSKACSCRVLVVFSIFYKTLLRAANVEACPSSAGRVVLGLEEKVDEADVERCKDA